MKKILVLLTLLATVSAYAQGTVRFSNKQIAYGPNNASLKNSKVKYGDGGPVTLNSNVTSAAITIGDTTWGVNAKAALYAGNVGSDASSFVMITPIAGFMTGIDAGYWDNTSITRTIPGHDANTDVFVQVRVWDTGTTTGSYEEAAALGTPRYLGMSEIMQVTLGGTPTTGGAPLQAAQLVDNRTGIPMQPFVLTYVPEPSIIGLGLLGAVAGLFVFRRRN